MAQTATDRRVGDLTEADFSNLLSGSGLPVRIGPFNANIRAPIERVHATLFSMYAEYPLIRGDDFFSFHTHISERRALPAWHRKLVRFAVDGRVPHEDLPAEQALPVLEWGINLVIALRSHCFLMLHSAVLERRGGALLLPAAPGFGKTTLCTALAHNNWRLLSDEFGLIRPRTREFVPVPRPMGLKNESIEVIRNHVPEAVIGPAVSGTRKGTVAHAKPPAASVVNQDVLAEARWIVFPRWEEGAGLSFEPLSKVDSFMMLAMNAFNYELLGEAAFRTVQDIVAQSRCYRLVYSDIDEALGCLQAMVDDDG